MSRRGQTVVAVSACLLACLTLGLVLEAIDSDPDLYPLGAEQFEAAGLAWTGGAVWIRDALRARTAASSPVGPPSIYLIETHRARSALSDDTAAASLTPLMTMAEPGRAPASWLGQFFCAAMQPSRDVNDRDVEEGRITRHSTRERHHESR